MSAILTAKEKKYLRQYKKKKHKCICLEKDIEKCCKKCKDMIKSGIKTKEK